MNSTAAPPSVLVDLIDRYEQLVQHRDADLERARQNPAAPDLEAMRRARRAFIDGIRTLPWSQISLDDFTAMAEQGIDAPVRAQLAATVARLLDDVKAETEGRRNNAVWWLLAPFDAAQAAYQESGAPQIEEKRRIGEPLTDEQREHLDAARAQRRTATTEAVTWTPIAVQGLLDTSKKTLVRIRGRAPRPQDRVEVPDAVNVARLAHRDHSDADALGVEIRELRDDLIRDQLIGRLKWSNADVARLVGLTTARVAQLRYYSR